MVTYPSHSGSNGVTFTNTPQRAYVDLPIVIEEHSQVIFYVDILDESGELLYSTYSAEYKIGSKQ